MPSCLGLYIQDNLIKYAKVTKDRDNLKVEAFGVKFYDEVSQAINQIVSETFSYKTPISVNLSDESYNYFYMFSLLSKNDLKKAIDTEFDSFCFEKGINRSTIEGRYALVPDMEDKQKIKVIYISSNKIDLNRRLQQLEDNSVSTITALPISIANIMQPREKENSLIVNIEDKTTITTIIDQKIYNVETIDSGASEFLSSISAKENSYAKAYEICKNTTIYTIEGRELQGDENLYLQDVMPTLYNVVQGVKSVIDNTSEKIERIYITGTAADINNIDLYFQEYFTECKCEILRPYFIPETVKINMKDYIEVNSAIALALQGLGYGVKDVNFKHPSLSDRLPAWMKFDIGKGKNKEQADKENGDKENDEKKKSKSNILDKFKFKMDLKGALDNTEKWLIRSIAGIFSFIVIYTIVVSIIAGATSKKMSEAEAVKQHTETQISNVEQDTTKVDEKTTEYKDMTETINNIKNQHKEDKKVKNSIPNFLTSLMFAVPKGVKIDSITNTSGYNIRVVCEAKLYSQLAYLIGKMKTTGMLYDVTVSASVKKDDVITVVIEGTLFPE